MDITNYSYFYNWERKFLRAPIIEKRPYQSSSMWFSLTDEDSEAYRVKDMS